MTLLPRVAAGVSAALVLVAGCSAGDPLGSPATDRGDWPPAARLEVVATHPHDEAAFTQGLVVSGDGRVFESVGNPDGGLSDVREVDLASGEVLRRQTLDGGEFGEGLTLVDGELVQLTWTEEVAFRWRPDDLAPAGTVPFEGEGWGLSTDGRRLLTSDGTSTLAWRDPGSLAVLGELEVRLDGEPVEALNELEVLDGGVVAANVWKSDRIVVVDLDDGAVVSVVDAAALVPPGLGDGEVLNGIAHRPGDPPDRWLVTGKRWPVLYEVRVVPA